MSGINAGDVLTFGIEHGGELIAIGEAVASDLPKIAGLFKRTQTPDGVTLTPEQIAALVADTATTDSAIETRADAEIADAQQQLDMLNASVDGGKETA